MKIKNQYISALDFIKNLDENGISLVLPPLQRPQVWNKKKINKILSIDKESEYFGSILLLKRSGEYLLIDGQQRITNFILMYKFIRTIRTETLIENKSIENEYALAIKFFFGSQYKFNNKDKYDTLRKDTFYKNNLTLLNQLGYLGKMNAFDKKRDVIEKLLSTIKIHTLVINSPSSKRANIEHDLFLSLNNEGTPLSQSDIVKSLFLQNYNQKKLPIDINTTWQKSLIEIQKKKSNTMDKAIRAFLFQKGRNITANNIVNYYKKKFALLKQNQINNFINNEVTEINEFINTIYKPTNFTESKESFNITDRNVMMALKAFALTEIYTPLQRFIPWIDTKKKSHSDLKKYAFRLLTLIYLTVNNKVHVKEQTKNMIRPWNIRSKTINFDLEKISIKAIRDSVFLNQPIHKKTNELFTKKIIRIFSNNNIGRTIRAVVDIILDDEKRTFSAYKTFFSTEHIVEKFKINNGKVYFEKDFTPKKLIFLEEELHKSMNFELDVLKKENNSKKITSFKYYNIKNKYYSKSTHPFTKKLDISKPKKYQNDIFSLFYSKKVTKIIENIAMSLNI